MGGSDNAVALAEVEQKASPYDPDEIRDALRKVAAALRWTGTARGAFGAVVAPGARVVVKPNWVMHRNRGPFGLECLVTQAGIIQAVVHELLSANPARVTLGDAPLQGCDFPALMSRTENGTWARELEARDNRFNGPIDFRRTRSRLDHGVLIREEPAGEPDDFILFDLGRDSLLEEIATDKHRFRVTQYDPKRMRNAHAPGRHQYLVARAFIDADVVFNLPKLKTHRKAGLTGALKNLVGINGNKEFLPHHRAGGATRGGDSYPGRSLVKSVYERLLDLQNSARSHRIRRILDVPARALAVMSRLMVDDLGVEGAWAGNETIWRMTLDLNRILLYGRLDGTLADTRQRASLTVMDAVTVGQGDGPLASEPFSLGLLVAGSSSAAVDQIGAQLLGYDPNKIQTAREAFSQFRWPLASFGAGDVQAIGPDGAAFRLDTLPLPDLYPEGWLNAVDNDRRGTPPTGRVYIRPIGERLSEILVEG
jgi:uncharacterized protein (DUF362 family)